MKKFLSLFIFSLLFFVFVCPSAGRAVERIDINTASLAQLDGLTGIGPKYAQAIIDGRPYSSVDDLDRVKGIGPSTLQKIKDQGLACVNCDTTSNTIIPAKAGIQSESTNVDSGFRQNDTTGIFINEILPAPKGADETDEWIELYNSNDSEIDLSDWQIKDAVGTAATFKIPQSTKILAKGFLIFKRPATKIMLNNDGDGLNLLTPNSKTADAVNYTKAPTGQSYNRKGAIWTWSVSLTPGSANIIAALAPAQGGKNLSNSKKSDNKVVEGLHPSDEDLTAALSQNTNQNTSPWFLFFIVLATTLIMAALVLFIKHKYKF